MPNGTLQIMVNLTGDSFTLLDRTDGRVSGSVRGALVAGPHSRASVIDASSPDRLIGVAFKPGGAFPFLGMPAGELCDQCPPLEALWGARAGELRERLLEAPDAAARFRVLERALLFEGRQLGRHPAVAYALARFQSRDRTPTVAEITERVGLSARHFIQLFGGEVGLTPKLYSRIRRFQNVLAVVHRRPSADWADVATSAGYYDQAHLIHDFRDLGGLTPSAYLARQTSFVNHVRVD